MAIAFVFMITEMGHAESVLKALKKIAGVKEAYMVYGVYDVIAKIEADTMDKLGEIVTGRMQRLDKVRSTQLMVVHEHT